MEDKKVFVIVNSYYIGDILLINSLIQNIKRIYKNSWVVMLTPPSLYDVAKYQYGVDDVIIWDRKGSDKGFWNFIKFILRFPYKKIYAAFPIYSMDRPVILSKLLGAKYILGPMRKLLTKIILKSKYPVKADWSCTQKANMELLSGITEEELIDCPMKFCPPEETSETVLSLKNTDYIVICPKTSRVTKDIPDEKVCEIIEKYPSRIVLLGSGEEANKLSEIINKKQYTHVVNLIGKSTIVESAQIIKNSKSCISADTGMLHMSCALNKPTIGLFYEKPLNSFAPKEDTYPLSKNLIDDNVENILNTLDNLIEKSYKLGS